MDAGIGDANVVLELQTGCSLSIGAIALHAIRERLEEKIVGAKVRVIVELFRAFEGNIAGSLIASPDTVLSRRRRRTRKN